MRVFDKVPANMKKTLCLLLAMLLPSLAQAQAEPDAEALIRLLKPGTTRGLRNLTVQAAPPAAPALPVVPLAAVPEPTPPSTVTPPAVQVAPAAPAVAQPAPSAPSVPPAPAPSTEAAAEAPSVSLAIQFEYNSARVSAASRQTLQQLAKALQSPELAAYRFRIEGHTDAKGQAGYNRKLSQARADEVRQLLVAQGVAAARLSSIGMGASQLALPSQPFAAENRRVRIVNLAP